MMKSTYRQGRRSGLPFRLGAALLAVGLVAAPAALADDEAEREEEYHRDFIYGVPNNPT